MACNGHSHVIPKLFTVAVVGLLLFLNGDGVVSGFSLTARVSQHGLHGEIHFSHKNDSLITVRTDLRPTLQFPDGVFRWSIREFPVNYDDVTAERCSERSLGRELVDLTEELGYLIIPGKDHAEFESKLPLTGARGLWGKSIVLETAERDRVICASIHSSDQSYEMYAVAKFTSPIGGSLTFRWMFAKEVDEYDSYILSDLHHTRAVPDKEQFTRHNWKLFVTDIFDSDKGNHEDNCNVLQMVFDPENAGDGMSVGDLDTRLGQVKVATDATVSRAATLYKDEVIDSLRGDMEVTKRSLYVVIYDHRHADTFVGCAKLRTISARSTKALVNMDGVMGVLELSQRSPHDATWLSVQLGASDLDYEGSLRFVSSVLGHDVTELPPRPPHTPADLYSQCNTTGGLYNPTDVDVNNTPPPGMGTQDQYPVGDLFGKHKDRAPNLSHKYLLPGLANELSGAYWDLYLPLQGRHSVVHRGFLIRRRRPKRDICATIIPYEAGTEYQTAMSSAQAVFRYPIVGRVVFTQPQGQPWEDTTIIIETMVHADGTSVNNTHEHRWALHEHPPGKDYYNWTARCLSAGSMYEPHRLDVDARHPAQYCSSGLCRLGDLTTRHGLLSIAGKKMDSARLTRRLFTDSQIALSGKYSILRRSLVIYDDHGPVARGERLACTMVNGLHRRKAVVRDWFGNGSPVQVSGRLEVTQQSEYHPANVQLTLDALDNVHDYRIHPVPVERELEFPCERTTLYDTYNPLQVDKALSPPPAKGTSDQYELGDLGMKFGLLDEARTVRTDYNDTQLSLFGPLSVLGRSLVLHKKGSGIGGRWACASVERGYSPSEARELRAIASFHHPGGFARGYVRMTQLVHGDGSTSDTVIEVNLRYPGERDRNLTHNHNWSVFVNPVGVDAAVRVTNTRCVAAGYRWNPYFTQLADPLNVDLYNQECGVDNPLRCDVGDLTARLGTISVGDKRQVFVDSNLPLEGVVSAMGRSIVVFGPERSGERFACANIQPDKDIIKYVNVMKTPRFVLGQFLDDVRAVLGAPAWMVGVDARRTRTLHAGACLQLLLHFSGPDASRLELDFTKLLSTGRLESSSIFIPGYVNTKRKSTLGYRQCGVTDPNDNKKNSYFFSGRGAAARAPDPLPCAALLALTTLLLA